MQSDQSPTYRQTGWLLWHKLGLTNSKTGVWSLWGQRVGIGLGLLLLLGLAFQIDPWVYSFWHEHFNYYQRPVPDALKIPHRVMRSLEDWGENVFIFCVGVTVWRLDRRRRSQLLALTLALLFVLPTVEVLKRLTGRERPEVSLGATVFHGPAKWKAGGDFQSFPSGHTAAAATYSGVLAAYYPPLRPLFILLATGTAGNRMWKERHFFSDCLVSGLFGFWVGFSLPSWSWTGRWLLAFDRRFSHQGPTAAVWLPTFPPSSGTAAEPQPMPSYSTSTNTTAEDLQATTRRSCSPQPEHQRVA